MKITIHKIRLEAPNTIVDLPECSVPIHVGQDGNGDPCLWYKCVPSEETERYDFRLVFTGEYYDEEQYQNHIGTFLSKEGLVCHIFY